MLFKNIILVFSIIVGAFFYDGHGKSYANGTETSDVIVFLSFSMPKNSLRLWIKQAYESGASVVIRGLHKDSFNKTTSIVSELISEEGGGVQIHPDLFKQYKIEKVPAVLVRNAEKIDVVYGDVGLDSALNRIQAG